MAFREPSKESPHRKFWEHIKAGGKVLRDDPHNKVTEYMDLERLGGDANEIQRYGYNNLTIQPEPSASVETQFVAHRDGGYTGSDPVVRQARSHYGFNK